MSKARENASSSSPQPTILNLVLLGTGYHRLQKKGRHLLTELANSIEIGPNQSVHLIDGLGGDPDADHAQTKDHPLLGTYNFQLAYQGDTGKITMKKTNNSSFFGTNALSGKVKGSGYHEAIDEAIAVIETMLATGKKPLIVNMFGFSRGADTALRICNILHSTHKPSDVKANVFAIDPVSGTGRRKAKKAQFIPNNVEEYHSILMQDENRLGFEPQDKRRLKVQDPNYTTVTYHLYGGNHNTSLRLQAPPSANMNMQNYDEITADTTRLVWDDLHKFAWRHATLVKNIPYLQRTVVDNKISWSQYEYAALSQTERFNAYTRMAMNRALFAEHKPTLAAMNIRELAQYKYDYLLHGVKYFQDKEHLTLFYMKYPYFFDYYFQKNMGGAEKGRVFAEILKMKQDPNLVNSLIVGKVADISKIDKIEQLDDSGGIYLTINDLKIGLDTLWENVLMIVNPVLTGQDESIDEDAAKKLVSNVLKILVAKLTAEEKIAAINLEIGATLNSEKKSEGIFLHKLSNLLSASSHVENKELFSKLIATALRSKAEGFKLFESKSLTKSQRRITRQILNMLSYIEILGMGNDRDTLSQLLNLALMHSRTILKELGIKKETSFDKFLRNSLVELTSYSETPKSDLVKEELGRLIVKFKNDLDTITTIEPRVAASGAGAAASAASASPISPASAFSSDSSSSSDFSPLTTPTSVEIPESLQAIDLPVLGKSHR